MKVLKVILIALIAVATFFVAVEPVTCSAVDVSSITSKVKNEGEEKTANEMTEIASKITGFIWILSIIVAVIVLMYTGLKFIVGSANEKAEYKKSLMPLVVGILILVFATTIVNAIFSIKS